MKRNFFNYLKPELFNCLKNGYNMNCFKKDAVSGFSVAIVAFPLSMALAIASGVTPALGLVTAIIGAIIGGILSGSKYQITAPTAAIIPFILIILNDFGFYGLIFSGFISAVVLLLLGVFKGGKLIKFFSASVTLGFTLTIAISIFSGQIFDFFGIYGIKVPIKILDKFALFFSSFSTISIENLLMGVFCIIVMLVFQKFIKAIPGSIVALILSSIINIVFNLKLNTIESKFGEIILNFSIYNSYAKIDILKLLSPAIQLGILSAIVSLLSMVSVDNLSKSESNCNAELVSQSAATFCCSLFGALPPTGAVARATVNYNGSAKSPLSAVMQGVFILLISLLFRDYLKLVPLVSLAAVLIVVCKNMINIKQIKRIFFSNKVDFAILLITITVGVIFNLLIAAATSVLLNLLIVIVIKVKLGKTIGVFTINHQLLGDSEEGKTLKMSGIITYLNHKKIIELTKISDKISKLDFSQLVFVDTQGLSSLVGYIKILQKANSQISIVASKKLTKKIYKAY